MTRKGNRRLPPGKKSRSPRSRGGSKRSGARPRGRARAVDPAERKVRNRTVVLLGLLALVNAYVFFWRGDGSLDILTSARPAVIGGASDEGGGPLGSVADPPASACGHDPVRIFDGRLGLVTDEGPLDGDRTLRLVLLARGATGASIDAALAAIQPSFDPGLITGSGAPVRTAIDREGGLQALEIELGEGHVIQACQEGGDFRVRTLQHPASTDVAAIELVLGPSTDLAAAIEAAGEAPELADRITDALAYDLDLATEARPADRIKVVIEKRSLGRAFHRYGPILGLHFKGAAGSFDYVRFAPSGGEARLYSAEGEPRERALRRSPVAYHRTPPGSRALLEPTLEVIAGRQGAMFRRPEGAPVVAIADATVRAAGPDDDLGLRVEVITDDGLVLRYGHLGRLLGDLRPGQRIAAGQHLGLAGHSGRAASDRIRLEALRAGEDGELRFVDPLALRNLGEAQPPRLGEALPEDEVERLRRDTTALRRLLR
ncbi:MAG: M23 family metallopeptidase [Nannocystaceae bacterium]